MKLILRQTLARERKSKLEMAIHEAIDKICEAENYEITYAEINSALLAVMASHNKYELQELWKDDVQDNEAPDGYEKEEL